MTEKNEETVILSLNLNEGQEAEYQTAQLDPSTSVRIVCSVDGETHSNADLGWVRDGALFTESQSQDTVLFEKTGDENKTSLKILEFDSSHVGEYECSVKRPKGKYQKAKIRLEIKPTHSYDPTQFGEVVCEPEISKICQNGGYCYRHETSQSISCRCLQSTYGNRCQYKDDNDVFVIMDGNTGIYTRTIAAGTIFSLCVLSFAIIGAYFCRKRMRANRSINRSYDDFLEKANRFSIRSNSSNFAKNIEKKVHQAVERVNSSQPNSPLKQNCQNCPLPYMRWSDSALSLKSSNYEQCSLRSHSFEQVSPKQTIVHMTDQNKAQVHELNCSKIDDIV